MKKRKLIDELPQNSLRLCCGSRSSQSGSC